MAKKKKTAQKNDKLQNALVLFHYVLRYFGCNDLKALSDGLKDPALEGVDDNGVSLFYTALHDRLFLHDEAKAEEVLEYDHHIVQFTKEINEHRHEPIRWKYYQYLTLLFTEVYLDRYFRDKKAFAEDLNNFLHTDFNQRVGVWEGVPDFTEDSLNKLAFGKRQVLARLLRCIFTSNSSSTMQRSMVSVRRSTMSYCLHPMRN